MGKKGLKRELPARIDSAPSWEELMPSEEQKRHYDRIDRLIHSKTDFLIKGPSPSDFYRIYGPIGLVD